MSAKSFTAGLVMAGLVLVAPCFAQGQETPTQPSAAGATSHPDLAGAEKQIIESANAFRKQHGHGPLKVNPDLSKAAHYFAKFMADTDKYGHTADGQEPWDRAKKFGYDYCIVEENIAYQFSSEGFTTARLANNFMEAWEHSPGHRRNLLNPNVGDTGAAVAHSSRSGKYYAVQMFGRPKSEAIRFSVANRTDEPATYSVDGKSYKLEPRYTMTHEVCVPPKLALESAGQGKEPAAEGQTIRPHAGEHFVIERNGSGKLTIREQ